ncbi:MAG: membrane lipoprotein lipid attachment site-containing protein [Bacillaceae bacterium]|nr:membrane lipoprotein lipid attachment site-containing protein [Bacillaceae bacterium]
MKKILTIICAIVILSGCGNLDSNRNYSLVESYAAILVVDGKDYVSQGEVLNEEFTADEKIGEVKYKVKKEVKPIKNFETNFYNIGDEIFSSKEDKDVLIVITSDRSIQYITVVGDNNK